MTTAYGEREQYPLIRPKTRSFSMSLEAVGLITIVTAAWAGIIPFVGPTFGYSGDGAASWHWDLTHAVLALVPGAVAFVCGISLLAPVRPGRTGRRRLSLGLAGTLITLCGAWFVVGPLAWPVLNDVTGYFVSADPLRNLANQVGYALGPGIILAACGAFTLGWTVRHDQTLGAVSGQVTEADTSPADPGEPYRTVA